MKKKIPLTLFLETGVGKIWTIPPSHNQTKTIIVEELIDVPEEKIVYLDASGSCVPNISNFVRVAKKEGFTHAILVSERISDPMDLNNPTSIKKLRGARIRNG